jgi:hypothetical protein
LNNFKYRNTRKHLGHSSVTLREIIQWCEEKSEVPEDPDEVSCGGFKYKFKKSVRNKAVVLFII